MTDIRKVRPVAALDATRSITNEEMRESGWLVNGDGSYWRPGTFYPDAEFAAHFMPAELFDAVLTAARVVGHAWLVWDASPSGTDEEDDAETALLDAAQNAYVAVRAYDAHRPTR